MLAGVGDEVEFALTNDWFVSAGVGTITERVVAVIFSRFGLLELEPVVMFTCDGLATVVFT